jgi:hypothetical protein
MRSMHSDPHTSQTQQTPDTWYLWRLFGWTAPVACYAFFLVAVLCNALLIRPLVPLVYTQVRVWLNSDAHIVRTAA